MPRSEGTTRAASSPIQPDFQEPRLRRARKSRQHRKFSQELPILRENARYLRLLQHHLGDENLVRIARSTPWHVSPIGAAPIEDYPLEFGDVHNVEFAGPLPSRIPNYAPAVHDADYAVPSGSSAWVAHIVHSSDVILARG